jgi:integrase
MNSSLNGMPAIAAPPDPELVDEFVDMSDRDSKTLKKYRQHLLEFRAYLDQRANGKSFVEVDKADVLRFLADLKKGTRYGFTGDGKPRQGALGWSTQKSVVSALRAFYGHCVDLYGLTLDPTYRIRVKGQKPKRGLTLSDGELKRVLDAPGRERCRIQAYLQAYTAARTMSLRFLLWSDVVFERNEIHFNAKAGNDYTVFMHPQLKAALLRWYDEVHQVAEKNLLIRSALADRDTAYVLLTRNGRPLCHSTMAKQAKWRAQRVGVLPHADRNAVGKENASRIHPHAIRRTRGTQLRSQGVDLADIADLLNHKDLNTTREHYAFTSTPRLKQTVMALTL